LFEVKFFGNDTGPQSFVHVYCPVANTLFEVSPEIRCLSVPSYYCYYRNHAAGYQPILSYQLRIE